MNTLSILFVLGLLALCTQGLKPRGSTIVIGSHERSSEWWLAFTVSDLTTTSVDLLDAGNYADWMPLEATNWGYWIFAPPGLPVAFPISLRLCAETDCITLTNIFLSASPGASVDTKLSYSGSSQTPPTNPDTSTDAPTPDTPTDAPAPATEAPAPATEAPAAPTDAPAPATEAPAPPTDAPEQPTDAPAPAPATEAPAPPTQAPAQPTEAPAQPTQAPAAPTQAPPAPPSAPAGGNPFDGTQYYINPHYTLEVDSSIAENPSLSDSLSRVKAFASAFWIDRMSVVDNVTTILTQARIQASQSGNQVMVALVVYDLPARDCAAAASNGEIPCADAACTDGITTYKSGYIDQIVKVFQNFPDITIVAIIEPDSLPNLATNLAVPKCTIAHDAYITGVSYAVQQLSQFSNVHMYIDAAHGGWLGWDTGRAAAVAIFKQVLDNAGGASKIRGFATNVANYQPLGSMTDTADPCNLAGQYNFATNEVKYVSLLDASLAAAGITGMHYIIDTGRNGVVNSRTDCSNWCNIKNAGLGIPPTSSTSASGLTNIDAYFWVKPPGESDGTSDTSAQRYDFHCGSSDSRIPAPEAGNWFSEAFVAMASAANPPL